MASMDKLCKELFDLKVRYAMELNSIAHKYGLEGTEVGGLASMDKETISQFIEYGIECDFVFPDV